MALKRLNNVEETVPATKSGEMPVVKVSGRSVARFNRATAELKAQEIIQQEERAKLLKKGLDALYEFNIANPTNPATSVKLVQDQGVAEGDEPNPGLDGDGDVVRLTFQNRYSASDADTADSLFETLLVETNKDRPKGQKLSINDFMQETVGTSFDSKIFLTGENGQFDQGIYNAYSEAIAKVTADLVKKGKLKEGTKSPLGTTKKVLPLANFHEERWSKFPTVDAQQQIREVVSNTVTLTPVAAK